MLIIMIPKVSLLSLGVSAKKEKTSQEPLMVHLFLDLFV